MHLMSFVYGLKYVFPTEPGAIVRGVLLHICLPQSRNIFRLEQMYMFGLIRKGIQETLLNRYIKRYLKQYKMTNCFMSLWLLPIPFGLVVQEK